MTFYRLVFGLAFQLALERHFFALGPEKPPKMESKPSQNAAQNAFEIDLMLRTLKSDFEQTLPHFCSFLLFRALQKSSWNRLKNTISVTSSRKDYKKWQFSDFRPYWLPNWLQHESQKVTQNRAKTWKNRLEISTKPTRRSQNGSEPRKMSKNMQKSSKKIPTWPHHVPRILTQSMPKASIGRDFLGTGQTFKNVQQSTTAIPTWLHQTSAVGEVFSKLASKNTVHFFHFSTIACMHMVSQSWALEPLTMIASSSCKIVGACVS